MQRLVEDLGLETLKPGDRQTRPNVYYRNLHRFQKCFIAGSLAQDNEGQSDCLAGAVVRLFHDGKPIAKTKSDDFGDFKFDGLAPNSGRYRIVVEHGDAAPKEVEVDLHESCSVGTVRI